MGLNEENVPKTRIIVPTVNRENAENAYGIIEEGKSKLESAKESIAKCRREVPRYVVYDSLSSNTDNNLEKFDSTVNRMISSVQGINAGGATGTSYYLKAKVVDEASARTEVIDEND